jgi:large subunit ribosomal protein L24
MNRIRKGDSVKIISGNYKGQTGRVIKMFFEKNRVLVEGINKVKKHARPTQDNPQGGIIEKEMSINMSNLMLLDKNKPVKVSFKVSDKGKRVRINRKNGSVIK